MKRVQTFDFIRALATMGLIALHALYYQWTGVTDVDVMPGEPLPSLDVQIFSYIIYLAGLFFMISGAVQTMSIYNKLQHNDLPQNLSEPSFLRRYSLGGILMGVILLIYHLIFNLFFNPLGGELIRLLKNDPSQFSLENEQFFQFLFHRDAPSILGLNFIFVSIVTFILFRKQGWKKISRNLIILGILATAILVFTPLVRYLTFQPAMEAIENQQWLKVGLLSMLWDIYFPIFPYTGFALYGVMIGIVLAQPNAKQLYKRLFIPLGIIYFTIGGYLLFSEFGGLYLGLAQYPNPNARLLPNYDLGLVKDGMHFRTYLNYNQLGFAFLGFYVLFQIFDFRSPDLKQKRIYKNRALFRLGNISLTAFIVEGVVRQSFGLLWTLIYPGWNDSLYLTFAFGIFNVLIWLIGARFWYKVDYKFSFEWLSMQIVKILSGKKSSKFKKIPQLEETHEPLPKPKPSSEPISH